MTAPAQEHAHARSLALGACTLDLAAGELLGADHEPVPLRRQALELLLVLGRRASQVVGKDELMAAVWPDVVVGEGSLTQTIADVRRALGDSEHRLVRNVARRGYRLVAGPRSDVPPLSLVVLPLVLEGAADDAGWFADALHGDFIIELARLQGALVIARDTAATYAGRAVRSTPGGARARRAPRRARTAAARGAGAAPEPRADRRRQRCAALDRGFSCSG